LAPLAFITNVNPLAVAEPPLQLTGREPASGSLGSLCDSASDDSAVEKFIGSFIYRSVTIPLK
jgi:hypothetical protein